MLDRCLRLLVIALLAASGPVLCEFGDLPTASARPGKSSRKKSAKKSKRPVMKRTKGTVAGGRHWRIESKNGPIHVWVPRGYKRDNAGLVVYVHGYRISADGAWKRHKLAQQFKKSRQNAMFLVIEAPKSNDDKVKWTALGELKKTVRRAGMRLPDGPSIAIAHSGGYRTIAKWVDNRLLAQVIMLDAMYGGKTKFDDFIHSGKRAKHHKMVIVAANTADNSLKFAKKYKRAVIRKRIPDSYSKFSKRERRAKLLYIQSQYGHGAIASGGKVLPMMLRLTPLARL